MKYLLILSLFFISQNAYAAIFKIKPAGVAEIVVRVELAAEIANIKNTSNSIRIQFTDLETNDFFSIDRNGTFIQELK